jgi:hypothetical protein
MLLSGHQNAGQNYDMKIANISSENVSQFILVNANNKCKFDSGGN